MFTGIIQEVGRIDRIERASNVARLAIVAPSIAPGLETGESVAINGCCLTVEKALANGFEAFATPETLARTTLGQARPSSRVNIERALAVGDRLGGHFVSGHVDGIGRVADRRETGGGSWEFQFDLPGDALEEVIAKGSIAIDGASLTIARLTEKGVVVAVIPETMTRTTLSDKRVGADVNIETDMIGKYVRRQMGGSGQGLTIDTLRNAGF